MAITSTFTYLSPDIAEYLDEAFERAGVDPLAIGQNHIDSALRSIRFLFSEWNTYGMREWMMLQVTQTLTAADTDFDLPAGTIMIFDAVLRRQGRDTPMYAMSRDEFLMIPDKTVQGRPSRYFEDKKYDRVTVNLWQSPENSTDIMVMNVLKNLSAPGNMANTLQLPPTAYECFVAGLAMRLAQKFSREMYEGLRVDYGGREYPQKLGGKIFHMLAATAENADVQFSFRGARR